MNPPAWTKHAADEQWKLLPRQLLLTSLLVCALTAEAQSVVAPAPAVNYAPPALPQNPAATNSSAPAPSSPIGSSPFQWGPVTLSPHFSYRFLYGDGIQAAPGQQSRTTIQAFSPGVLFSLGTHWTLDYTPTQTYYSDPVFKDTLDHTVRLAGATTSEDWIFQFSQDYTSSSSPLIETGQQTREKSFGTALSGSDHFNSLMTLDSTLTQQVRLLDIYPDSREWSVVERLHYRFSSQLDGALGAGFGYVSVSAGSDMTYIRPEAQISWRATDKLSLELRGGFENRKFRSGGVADLNTPTMNASINYLPFETTTLSVAANRTVAAAYFQNEVTQNTSWNINLRQRLLQHFYLSSSLTQQKTSYLATSSTVAAGRSDRNYSFDVRLSTTFFQRGTIAVLYQNAHNTSNSTGFGFSSSQVGVELGYRY